MKAFLVVVVAACLAVVGCDYTVPLAAEPALDIDAKLVGLWEQVKAKGEPQRLLVLPLSPREYLVSYPAGTGKELFAKACLWRGAGQTLVQLQWIGTAAGAVAEDARVYQFAAYELEGDELRVRLLNRKLGAAELKTPADLAKAIADAKDRPDLFRPPIVFRKVTEE